ncbi:MAG: SMP-30/gluconolactonase/LRE family protein [Alphaproteobacteria bacterium]
MNAKIAGITLCFALAVIATACDAQKKEVKQAPLPTVQLTRLWTASGFKQPESVVLDPKNDVLYVSNIDGNPSDKDGNGFISRVGLDGKVLDLVWVGGLNAPKGLGVYGGHLYAADIDAVVDINIADKTVKRYQVPAAKFLNDVAIDAKGRVYVSDMMDDAIYRLENGRLGLWVKDPKLASPNGLLVENDRLVVGSWGVMTDGFATKTPGHLVAVSMTDGKVTDLGSPQPFGNVDGVEPDGQGNYFVTDWMAGVLYHVSPTGTVKELLKLHQGSADLTYLPDRKLLIVPMMNDGTLIAYEVY